MFKKVFSLEGNYSRGELTYNGKMNSTKDAIYLDKYKIIFLLIALKYVMTAFHHQKEMNMITEVESRATLIVLCIIVNK